MSDVTPAPVDPTPATAGVPAGWYPESGRTRWWDGTAWTEHYQPTAAPTHTAGPMTAQSLNVNREVIYNRQQKGHSLILHIFLAFLVVGLFTIPYYTFSPNHYWHA